MAKPDLGEKQVCPECEKKFYDLGKNPAICPYCGHSFDPSQITNIPGATPKSDPVDTADDDLDESEEAGVEIDEEDIDVDEVVAQELELDGDASFAGATDDEDGGAPDIEVISVEDEDIVLGEDDADILPPTEEDSLEDVLAEEAGEETEEGEDDA